MVAEAKRKEIPCRIHHGTQRDAILFACGANASHGLRRTNADKRRAVEVMLNDEVWVTWADNKIAERAAVDQSFVSRLRKELMTNISSPAAKVVENLPPPVKARDEAGAAFNVSGKTARIMRQVNCSTVEQFGRLANLQNLQVVPAWNNSGGRRFLPSRPMRG